MKLSQFRGKDRVIIIAIMISLIIIVLAAALTAFLVIRTKVGESIEKHQIAQEQHDKEAAESVIQSIGQIGEVSVDSGEAIQLARADYDALNETQKELVKNYETLVNAEKLYAELPMEEEKDTSVVSKESEDIQEDTDTIHRYEYIVEDCTWSEAMERCHNKGGYLANINSKEELEYVISVMNAAGLGDKIFYLGGKRDNESDYYWVNHESEIYGEKLNGNANAWCYDIWMNGEPSFSDGQFVENVMTLFYFEEESRWVFNDVPDDILSAVPYYSGRIAYICEFEE